MNFQFSTFMRFISKSSHYAKSLINAVWRHMGSARDARAVFGDSPKTSFNAEHHSFRQGDWVSHLTSPTPVIRIFTLALLSLFTVHTLHAAGGMEWSMWNSITGATVKDLTQNPKFLQNPDLLYTVNTASSPINQGNNYGGRMRGVLTAPVTGSYTFWLSSDNCGELWLGSAGGSRFTKTKIITLNSWTSLLAWDDAYSATVSLTAGQQYWIEALFKEASGEDHVEVAWAYTGQSRQVIPGSALTPPGADANDADDDGLPDSWQATHPVKGAFLDPDRDSLTNLYEYQNSTNPLVTNREYVLEWNAWYNIGGTSVSNLTQNSKFLLPPEEVQFTAGAASPTGVAENFGARLRGTITAPVTGNYTFWISADDNAELWLGTSASRFSKQKIAWVAGWTFVNDWNNAGESNQQSASIALVAGQKYWIEALVKEGSGGDHVEIAWAYTGQTLQVIPASACNAPDIDPDDLDDDGLPDSWQAQFGMNNGAFGSGVLQYNVRGAFSDFDQDGMKNLAEYIANTNPANLVSGNLSWDVWMGVAGDRVDQLVFHPKFLNTPDASGLWAGASYPTANDNDYFGQRFRGYLIAPDNGAYTFWIASDDNCELWLSTDDHIFQKRKIASLTTAVVTIPPITSGSIFVNNGSAETPNKGGGGWDYHSGTVYGWTFNGGGIAHNGSPWFGPNATSGNQAIFIQGSDVQQEITLPADGIYSITFKAVGRGGDYGPSGIKMELDGNELLVKTAGEVGQSAWQTFSVTNLQLTAGVHTLKFLNNNTLGGDKSVCVDDVQISGTDFGIITLGGSNTGAESPALSSGEWNSYSGDIYGWNFNGGGIARNGSPWFTPPAQEGSQAVYIQSGSVAKQFTVPISGVYDLSFNVVGRGAEFGPAGVIVDIDGTTLLTKTAAEISQTAWETLSISAVSLPAGVHTITFTRNNSLGGDKSLAIDALKIEASRSAVSNGAVVYGNFDYFPTTQQSAPITLQANQKYYIEVLHKDGSGSEHVEVAWQRPGGSREIIPSQYVSSYVLDPNDQDDDGLLDSWETANGLSATDNGRINGKNGMHGDPDHDGLTNLQEYQQSSNPNSSTQSREVWTYDAVGNVETYTTRGGQVKTCTYDTRNRELTCNWSDSTPDVTMTYDDAGRLTTMTSSVSALSYTYNDANQMLTETQDINSPVDLPAKTVTYTYNNSDGLRDGLNYPDGTALTYTFTNRNQLKDIVSGGNAVATYAYDLNGDVATNTLINGTLATYSYDNASRLTNVAHTKSGANLIAQAYTLNAVGNRTKRTETVAAGAAKVDKYAFDPTDQLIEVKYNRNDGAGTQDRKTDFAYDPAGNRTTMDEDADGSGGGSTVSTPYTTNSLNQYTSIDSLTTPAYDNRGNITTLQTVSGGPTWIYTYDAQNRLISASGSNGVTASFEYDPRNRCVARTISSSTLLFVWDGWNLIEERNSSDVVLANYVHGARVDELINRTDSIGTFYYHQDGLGNTAALTNGSGNLVERYTYDVYGQPSLFDGSGGSISTTAYGNRFLYTGREWLSSGNNKLDLYDYRNRLYAPGIGRFIQTDPIRFGAKDVNLYRYVSNIPTLYTDPSGLVCGFTLRRFAGSTTAHQWIHGPGANVGFYPHGGGCWLDENAYTNSENARGEPRADPDDPDTYYEWETVLNDKGTLPDGTPCKCAPCDKITEQINNQVSTDTPPSFNKLTNNCRVQSKAVLKSACLKKGKMIHRPKRGGGGAAGASAGAGTGSL